MHENLNSKVNVEIGSDRNFGLVFALVFALAALSPLRHGGDVRLWAMLLAITLIVVSLVASRLLHPFNLLWFRLGLALHFVMTPLVMGIMFYLVITPIGVVMRLTGKDPLRLKRLPASSDSYWILRQSPGPTADSMKHQF